jgi:DNA polymerase-3 subunit gamma/tau
MITPHREQSQSVPNDRIEITIEEEEPKVLKKEVPKKEVVKTVKKTISKFEKANYRSPYSLENILKEEKKKDSIVPEYKGGEDMPKTPFGQEQVDKYWKLFVQNHVDKKNRSLFTTLNQRTPDLGSNFKLVFPIENKVQLNQIDAIKVDLVNYLREHLANYALTFETPLKKLASKKHIYSDEEKYKAMAEKYPLLEKLREKLDLDLNL